MRALVAAPAAQHKVELRDVPDPVPRAEEALVAVRAVSLVGQCGTVVSFGNSSRVNGKAVLRVS